MNIDNESGEILNDDVWIGRAYSEEWDEMTVALIASNFDDAVLKFKKVVPPGWTIHAMVYDE